MSAAHRVRRRAALAATLAAAALGVAACGAAGGSTGPAAPAWTPKPSFSGEGYAPGTGSPSAPRSPSPSSPGSSSSGAPRTGDPAVVATRLTAPTGVAVLPDNTALVGERTSGRIVRVQPEPDQPVRTVRTLRGISTAGGGGLLDLALSPHYAQDELIFAYITTGTDNRVVDFTLNGPVTPVLTGIPRGASGNAGRIAFAADGSLLVATGDAGHPAWARDPRSLAGKVLRVTDIGRPAPGDPTPGSAIFATGFRGADGLCTDTGQTAVTTTVFETEARPGTAADPVNRVVAGGAYGWPEGSPRTQQPLTSLPAASRSPGGCAVLGNQLYVTSLDGHALLAAQLTARAGGAVAVGSFALHLHNRYGRLRTVVAAPDGALWLTTSNRDGHGHPAPTDERVLRIVLTGGSGSSPY